MDTQIKEFIPLTDDLLFKETYGTPKNISFLEDLLESYYNYPEGALKGKVKVAYESQLEKTKYEDKAIRCDLQATVNDELIVNLEMYEKFNNEAWKKSKTYIMRIYSTLVK